MISVYFADVALGEKFISDRTKRRFGAVKVALTEISTKGTALESEGPTCIGNAVILTDHVGLLADDAGAIVLMASNTLVWVER